MQYILKSCFDHLVEASTLTNNWKAIILNTLLYFANAWKLSEEAARQKSESEASLYKYKSHTHVIESETDEVDIINHMFPDYEEEFSKYDDNIEPMDCHDKTEELSITSIDSTISCDVMVEVCMVYLLSSNVSTDHMPLLKCCQYKSSLLFGYLLAGSLTKQLKDGLPGNYILSMSTNCALLHCYETCVDNNTCVPLE